MRTLLLGLVLALSLPLAAHAGTLDTPSRLPTLLHDRDPHQGAAVDEVLAHPERATPPELYALSRVLFMRNRKDEAAFWFYAGQLRGRFDAERCPDISARAAVDVLNETFGRPINQYAFQNLTALEDTVNRVVQWDRSTPHDYDATWLYSHGLGVMDPAFDPKQDQGKLAETVRQRYLAQFYEILPQARLAQANAKKHSSPFPPAQFTTNEFDEDPDLFQESEDETEQDGDSDSTYVNIGG